jgi:integrase
VELIEKIVDRPAPGAARIALSHLTTIFNWAIARNIYGIEHSPCDRLDVKLLIGEKRPRLRVLTDAELRSLWNACDEIGYPFGPLVKMLMLTGCRLGEVAGARWTEFGDEVWTIPAERFKANAQHIVPLTDDMKTVLAALPRFDGNHLFSRMGKNPTNFSKARHAFDKAMGTATVAVDSGGKPADQWTYHDIRRTVRTRLSALRVPEQVAELVIGHDKKGLVRVYNQHAFSEEIKEALQAWNGLLRSIVDGSARTVIPFRAKTGF